jgi:hypothetical protein
VVGFDDLGNTDSFQTSLLEARLAASGQCFALLQVRAAVDAVLKHHVCYVTGVISPPDSVGARAQKAVFGFAKAEQNYNSDDE